MTAIGERQKQKREERGWSQSELARRMVTAGFANYTQMTVSRTEEGSRPVRLDEAVILSEVLGVSLNWLASGDSRVPDLYASGYRAGLDAARKAIETLS